MEYSRQAKAITGRKQYNPVGINIRPPYYPKQLEETLPKAPQGIMPLQPAIISKPKPLLNPPGDTDISAGLPEGFSNTSGFAPVNEANLTGQAINKGDIKGAIEHGVKGLASIATLPAQVPAAIFGPPVKKGSEFVKNIFSEAIPSNTESAAIATGSGPGMAPGGIIGSGPGAGMPADMGLPSPGGSGQAKGMPSITGGPMGGKGIDLADLDIGDFGGGGDVGPGGEGGGDPGAMGLGMGLGGDIGMGEW